MLDIVTSLDSVTVCVLLSPTTFVAVKESDKLAIAVRVAAPVDERNS